MSAANPIGSTAELETVTGPGDIIMLLPGEAPLEGGLALKTGQALIGLPEADRKPVITNIDLKRNKGNGIVLAQDNRIWNVRVENTSASGIIGTNVSGAWIDEVEINGANRSGSFTAAEIRALGGPMGHGGIVFIATGPDESTVTRIVESEVIDAAGIGIASLALGAAQSRLVVSDTRVENGTPVARSDVGIAAFAEGPSSEIHMEIDNSTVNGRLSQSGRNVIVFASADASAHARIERSDLGEAGQDGILAVATLIPAKVNLEIRNSVIEKAAQTNIEGTILNLPAFDPLRAHEASVSIEIVGSTIREAGAVNGFEKDEIGNGNIWIGSSAFAQQLDPNSQEPFPLGSYRLIVRNSRVEGASDFGLGFGGWMSGMAPEQSSFEVLLRENKIMANGSAEIMVSAPKALVDARRNCWGTSEGLTKNRILLKGTAEHSQLDVSEPVPCAAAESK